MVCPDVIFSMASSQLQSGQVFTCASLWKPKLVALMRPLVVAELGETVSGSVALSRMPTALVVLFGQPASGSLVCTAAVITTAIESGGRLPSARGGVINRHRARPALSEWLGPAARGLGSRRIHHAILVVSRHTFDDSRQQIG